jgi:hypothetical protein
MSGSYASPIVECGNCGMRDMWTEQLSGETLQKILPQGWVLVGNTLSGDAFFCGQTCERVWKSTREWKAPIPPHLLEALPLIKEVDPFAKWCECGMGPYRKQGIKGHQRSNEHRRRMAGRPGAPVGAA